MTPLEQQLKDQLDALQKDFDELSSGYYRNNFPTAQDFQKFCRFNTHLKVPHYAVTPATGEVGEIIEVGGIAYICSATNTWTKIGVQS